MREPKLKVSLEKDEVLFRCEFDRLADFEVQYSVSYHGDDQVLSVYQQVGADVSPLTEMEMEDVQYGSKVMLRFSV